jgi:hypothetical protein
VPSGVDEFPNVTEDDLAVAMPALSRLGALLIVHAELPGPIEAALLRANPPHPATPEDAIKLFWTRVPAKLKTRRSLS